MEVLVYLIPIAIGLVAVAVWFFVWAVDHDQFEDLDIHATDILHDPVSDKPTNTFPGEDSL